jgi:hypothetical protein
MTTRRKWRQWLTTDILALVRCLTKLMRILSSRAPITTITPKRQIQQELAKNSTRRLDAT